VVGSAPAGVVKFPLARARQERVPNAEEAFVDRPLRGPRRGRDDDGAARRLEDLARRHGRGAAHEEVSAVDSLADKAQAASDRLAGSDGVKGKLADELADDAVFLRKLKPSLMKKRMRGDAPTNEKPGEPRRAPAGPQLGKPPKPKTGGPSPFLVIGIALAAGFVLAKVIDWRGHAHPRW
jgi:hypothetical protein